MFAGNIDVCRLCNCLNWTDFVIYENFVVKGKFSWELRLLIMNKQLLRILRQIVDKNFFLDTFENYSLDRGKYDRPRPVAVSRH